MQTTEASEQEWDGEICISAQEYNNILLILTIIFISKYFQECYSKLKDIEIMQKQNITPVTDPTKWNIFKNLLTESFEKFWSENVSCS
jgi:hypothetical protein